MIPVCMCFDKTLENHVLHVIRSVRANTARDVQFYFLCTNDISDKCIAEYILHGVNVYYVDTIPITPNKKGIVQSPMMFARWQIPYMFDVPAVYLDNDVIVTGDIGEMYDEITPDYLIVAVRDKWAKSIGATMHHQGTPHAGCDLSIPSYYSGQLVINCTAWNRLNLTQNMLNYAYDNNTLDMITLNIFCNGRIKELPTSWCLSANSNIATLDTKLLHWHGRDKPWNNRCLNQEYFDKYAKS